MQIKKNSDEIILLVDDEPQILKALKQELEILPLDAPLSIVTCETTSSALEFLKENSERVFLLIADLRMPFPNLSGSDLLLQVHELYPQIILIMLTAYSDLPEIQKAITAEIQSLLFKPWDSNMLLAEIIKSRRLYHLDRENRLLQEKIRQQLEYAGEFQRKMLSSPLFETDDLHLELKYAPMPEYRCGGDYHDFFRLGPDKYIVAVGDVAGHGIKPAFITAMLKVLATTLVREHRNITASGFLTLMNKRLCRVLDSITDIVVTFSVLLIEPKIKKLHLANAGHLPTFLLRDGENRVLQVGGTALGFLPDLHYEETQIEIQKNDRLLLFTDGLIDLAEKQQYLDDDLILSILDSLPESEDLTGSIYERFKKFHRDGIYNDDVTVIAVTIQ